ncbi:MAG: DUF3320 domain-containing protein [Clostridia bacterium]|nr:DUF3320 domain-containing protein [Clostridia bacterium]
MTADNDRIFEAFEDISKIPAEPSEQWKDVQAQFDFVPVINYALWQNRVPAVKSAVIVNNSEKTIENAQLTVECDPPVCKPFSLHIDIIPAGSTYSVKEVGLVPDSGYLAGLTEKVTGTFTVKLICGGELVCAQQAQTTALAFDQWHGYGMYPELLTSFVTPNYPDIAKINLRASQLLEVWTGDPSLDGYQTMDANRVLKQAAAIYGALQELNIVYAVPPASFESSGQRVRLCGTVIEQRLGTCLDLTLLYASCLEAAGLHPLLILKPGHIFAGVWLEDLSFPEAVQDDPTFLTKRLAEGIDQIAVVECTLFTAGKKASFDEAAQAARKQLSEPIELFIDVNRARLSGILPLPVRVANESSWKIEQELRTPEQLTAEPKAVGTPYFTVPTAEEETVTKKTQWERKLLDLGIRNSLINLRFTKNLVPVLSSSLDELENALSDGSDFSVLARPADWKPGGDIDFENLHELGSCADVISSEFKNKRLRSAFTDGELKRSIKELYRSAKTSMEENGANTLYLALGLLRWYETERSTKPRYAPIVLLPVDIVRKSAEQGYVIRLRDDEPQMNITLLEKLKQDFGISVGGLDPLPLDEHGIDTRTVFTVLRKAVMAQNRWDVLESAYLGIFSFSQFVMWNDIRNRSDDLAKNKVVRSLMDGKLAWECEEMDIGEHVPEENVFLPLPADASQLFAIESACKGQSFVLHGPPGTGKSQTITALIANALAQGKTVLFVAEKMAALEVVWRRLKRIGLAPFCMELHSNKASKRSVLDQLRTATEVTKETTAEEFAAKSERLARLRSELDSYSSELHKKLGCGLTLYKIINIYEENKKAPEIPPFDKGFAPNMTPELLETQQVLVERLVAAAKAVGHPSGHPLASIGCTAYSQQLKADAAQGVIEYRGELEKMQEACSALVEILGKKMPGDYAKLAKIAEISGQLDIWKRIPRAWAVQENINKYTRDIHEMAERYLNADALRSKLSQVWTDEFFAEDGVALSNELRNTNEKWFLAKSIGVSGMAKRLSAYQRVPVDKDSLAIHFADLATYQAERAAADNLFKVYGMDLGNLYNGDETDWQHIKALSDEARSSAQKLNEICGDDGLRLQCASLRDYYAEIDNFNTEWRQFVPCKDSFYKLLSIEESSSSDWLAQQIEMCDAIKNNFDSLKEWITWRSIVGEAENAGLAPVVKAYCAGLEHENIVSAYKKCAFGTLAAYTITGSEVLNEFSGAVFNEKIEQYKRMDAQIQELTQQEIYCRLASRIPNFAKEAAQSSEIGVLQKAIRSGGRGVSIRKLFEQIPALLPRLCPCMLMSPISAAQYLDPKREPFDIIVFDEASQLPTCKAVGALARGKDAIIVGDPNQMPPTTFFMSNTVDEDNIEIEDLESILDDCLAINMPSTHLLWHYRSRHESLIAFSNSRFYENKLYTFPSVNERESKVSFVHIEGCFDRGKTRQNRAEAEAVIEEIKRRCHDEELCKQSVGVITFNVTQQNLIDDLLSEACRTDPKLDEWAYGGQEPLFIKNLENVQGDERDVILFSVGYGADSQGKVSMNFGPLNRDGGWRRLNVAVSRARCEMIVFSTLYPDQIDLSRTCAKGVVALREFLDFAANGKLLADENSARQYKENTGGIADSICAALKQKGYRADRAVGHSRYRVDIGVVDPKNEQRYILGIVLDGAGYGEAKTTRDREIAQTGVLEGLGWKLHRVWTMDWWDNAKKELEKIYAVLESIQNDVEIPPKEPQDIAKDNDLTGEAEAINLEDNVEKAGNPELFAGLSREIGDKKDAVSSYSFTELEQLEISPEELLLLQNKAKLCQKVLDVIEFEAPISESLLTKRVLQSYGITRITAKLQSYLNEIYRNGRLMFTIQGDTKFYWKHGQNPESYDEIRANLSALYKRDAKDVPLQEAANAAVQVLRDQMGLSHEDLVKESAKLMGFTRMGSVVTPLFEAGVEYASLGGRIIRDENGKWTLPE